MIYGMQLFTDVPGRRDLHVDRFRQATCALMEKQGIKVVGCWTSADDTHPNTVVYMIAHETYDELLAARQRFHADPVRLAMVAEWEKDGPIIDSSVYYALQPADFSPLQ